ncbi:tripartite tricarboxylate transporter permease [Halorutilales archaeon Cl-col2-1]
MGLRLIPLVSFSFSQVSPTSVAVLGILGFLLGTVSGLTPGLHVNTFALLLAGSVPAAATGLGVNVAPELLGVAIVAAAVTHTFLDIVPSLVVGVPDDSMALVALPGHRMVLDGRGHEALRLSALGSLLAVGFGVFVALPLTVGMVRLYPVLEDSMALVLGVTAAFLLFTEGGVQRSLTAAFVLVSSGLLGYYVLNSGETSNLLMPLFTGLFGMPVVATSALSDSDIPPQETDASPRIPRRRTLTSAASGSLAGGVVGWIPGISPALATVFVQSFIPGSEPGLDGDTDERSAREFIVAVSGVNSSNALFALLALYFIDRSRSGAMVALSDVVTVSRDLTVVYVGVAVVVSVAAFGATVALGHVVFRAARSVSYRLVTIFVVVLLVVLTFVLSGFRGIPILVSATAIGMVPNHTRVRRVHCMGSLLLPLVLFYV